MPRFTAQPLPPPPTARPSPPLSATAGSYSRPPSTPRCAAQTRLGSRARTPSFILSTRTRTRTRTHITFTSLPHSLFLNRFAPSSSAGGRLRNSGPPNGDPAAGPGGPAVDRFLTQGGEASGRGPLRRIFRTAFRCTVSSLCLPSVSPLLTFCLPSVRAVSAVRPPCVHTRCGAALAASLHPRRLAAVARMRRTCLARASPYESTSASLARASHRESASDYLIARAPPIISSRESASESAPLSLRAPPFSTQRKAVVARVRRGPGIKSARCFGRQWTLVNT
jgi:hypothetical protein